MPATVFRDADTFALPGPLGELLPEGGLRRGRTIRIGHSTALLLTLLAEVSRTGAWCAAVRLPSLGVAAAAGAGMNLDRFALVPAPGESWSTVVGALLDAIDVVVVAPPGRVPGALARRLSARARERRAVLLVVGAADAWEGADADLSVVASTWTGLGVGHGHLQSRTLEVHASGRRVGGRPRTAHIQLSPSGRVALAHPLTATSPINAVAHRS